MRFIQSEGISWLVGALICVLPGSAKAGSHVNSVWMIEPSVDTTEARLIAPGEMLVATRLLPPALAVLKDAVVDPGNDKYPIPAGTELFGTFDGSIWNPKPSAIPVFCEFKGFVAASGKRSQSNIVVRRCLVDSDNNGAFDGVFSTFSCLAEFPNIANFDLPKKTAAIAARYQRIAPGDIREGPTVGIVFDGFNYMNGGPRFFRAFGNGSAIPAFGRLSQKQTKEGLQELFGGRFAILGRETNRVNVELRQAIPAQPFAMLGGGFCLG